MLSVNDDVNLSGVQLTVWQHVLVGSMRANAQQWPARKQKQKHIEEKYVSLQSDVRYWLDTCEEIYVRLSDTQQDVHRCYHLTW